MEVLLVEGRGSDDEVLTEAGIERARAVIACMDSDAENIFATLTARELRPDIQIVARAARDSSERKLIRAGANEVVSPYKASGRTMAQLALDSRDGRATASAPRRSRRGRAGEDRGRIPPIPGERPGLRRAGRASAGGMSARPPPTLRGRRRRATRVPTLERPPRAEFGDYSTNVALLLAPALKAPPREIAERVGEGLERGAGRDARARRGRRARASSTCSSPTPGSARALAPIRDAGRALRRGRVCPSDARADPRRVRERQSDRAPDRRRAAATPPTATRSRGCSTFAGHDGRARVLRQRLRHPGRAVRRSRSPPRMHGRGAARGRLPGRLRGGARRAGSPSEGFDPADIDAHRAARRRADAGAGARDARALPRALRPLLLRARAARRGRASSAALEALEQRARLRVRGRDLAAHERRSATTRTACCAAPPAS